MQRLFSISLVFIFLTALFPANSKAQSSTERVVISLQEQQLRTPLSIDFGQPEPFQATSLVWTTEDGPGVPQLRIADADGNWSEWQTLTPDLHATMKAPNYISSLLYFPANTKFYEVQFNTTEGSFIEGTLHVFNPGHTVEGESSAAEPLTERVNCPCPQPDYEGRLDWCPSGNCPQDPTPEPTPATHIIIHHSAGVNSSNDWAAVVRSIWDYHVNSNGWDDIGYNWLVDANGVLYEGRGEGLQGAHFCGQNGYTVGICVLGNFQDASPTNSSLAMLREYLAWQTCDLGADPLDFAFHQGSGLSLYYISGHRDGCSTACPGDQFYPEFPALRQSVQDYIDNGCMAVEEPIDLTATATSNTSVELNWTDVPDAETGYEIERSDGNPSTFTWIASVNSSTTSYIDAGLTPGEYYYRVRAFGPAGMGAFSNEAYVSTIGVYTTEVWTPEQLQVHPNPFSDLLEVHLADSYQGEIRFDLLSVDGRQVRNLGVTEKTGEVMDLSWHIHDLPTGAYFLRGQAANKQFIIQLIHR